MSRKKSYLSLSGIKPARRGAILFVAVGALAVLSILALGATSGVLQQLKICQLVETSNETAPAALAIVRAMSVIFQHTATPGILTSYDMRQRKIVFGDITAEVTMTDEQSKVNILRAPQNVVVGLPGIAGEVRLAQEIAAGSIVVKEDLLGLDLMNRETYDALAPCITTYGSGVNINMASPDVLMALGIDSGLISKIQEYRSGPDGVEGTEDDKIFTGGGEIIPLLEPLGMTEAQKTFLQNLIGSGQLTTGSQFISYEIAMKRGLKTVRTFRIVAQAGSGAIASWNEE